MIVLSQPTFRANKVKPIRSTCHQSTIADATQRKKCEESRLKSRYCWWRTQTSQSHVMPSRQTIDWPSRLVHCCRLIEAATTPPSLEELAKTAKVSSGELQRQFTHRLGTSPKAYAEALRLHRLVRGNVLGGDTLQTLYAAGYQSVSSGYASARRHLDMTPAGIAKARSIGWWLGLSDLGWMLMAASEKGICWLSFGDQPPRMLEQLQATFPKACLVNDEARLSAWFESVREHILLPETAISLPLDVQGTAFQAAVWRALRRIPLGQTRSYSELAEEIGRPKAVRAVASACAGNKVSVLIPCHRVLGADGRLAGYRWGVQRKATLLDREAVQDNRRLARR